ncbi:MAG: zinc-dependent metalloprotease family protein [Microscillaceae bacterium]
MEVPLLSPALAQKLPQVRTYAGRATDHPGTTLRLDWTPQGLHAQVIGPEGTFFIDPFQKNQPEAYLIYWKKDFDASAKLSRNAGCGMEYDPKTTPSPPLNPDKSAFASGSQLRTYRLAVAATGEYTQFHNDNNAANGDAIADAQAAIITTINRVAGVYEREVAISFELVDNTDIVFDNGTTDPFSNNNAGALIDESQQVIDQEIGNANYDIGHTFSTGGGGLAALGSVCITGAKASGITGLDTPIGDVYDIDFVAHEIGHQFGGNHTFNGNSGSCAGGNRNGSTAYEPGSGTTIMAYAGICGSNNIQNNSNDYFHNHSFVEIVDYTRNSNGNNCPEIEETGNAAPVVEAGEGGFTIPISTPFALTGSATDATPQSLTYCWEQYDLGPAGAPNSPTGNAPLYRSFSPTNSPTRIFPHLNDILNNTQTLGEILPTYSRDLTFRLTVRDNQVVGGVDYDEISFAVSDQAGPFLITAPNTNVSWTGGSTQQITWDVANTDKMPVNCQVVNILLSTDGGQTFNTVLAEDVPNDGLQSVVVPNVNTTTARLKVEAADNIFFDISNQNFTITAATAPTFTLLASPENALACAPDPAGFEISIGALLGFSSPVTLSIQNLPSGLNATFGTNPIAPGNATSLSLSNTNALSSGIYDFTLVATSGGINRSLNLQVSIVNGTITPVLQSPANEAEGISIRPVFNWEDVPGAASYRLELATDAAFANVVVDETLDVSEYSLNNPLTSSTTYHWRVSVINDCGDNAISTAFLFQTAAIACLTFSATDLPISISETGTPTITSMLSIGQNGFISDVNVLKVKGTHTFISDLSFTLISPEGTSVALLDRICNNEDNFDLGFDSESGSATPPCPPTNGLLYQPEESLLAFNEENMIGNWTLRVRDLANLDGGQLTNWQLEICFIDQSNNTPPTIVRNEPLLGVPNTVSSFPLNNDLLLANDAEDPAASLQYVIQQVPARGQLRRLGLTLGVGSFFTQDDIDNGRVSYLPNNISINTTDSFRFRLQDSGGQRSEEVVFNIIIDVANSLAENTLAEGILISPNPTRGEATVTFSFPYQGPVGLALLNPLGQSLHQGHFSKNAFTQTHRLDLQRLPAGLYWLLVETDEGRAVKRIIKQ